MKPDVPHLLFINPWIHDFAAYDFWAKPLGLLTLAAVCRQHGFSVSYLDCLNRYHPRAEATDPEARNGRGPYLKTPIPKPKVLADVERTFSRYGILPEWFEEDLRRSSRPDVVLIGSLMTYWYPGVAETVATVRRVFPDIPIILGGIYATLCGEHAGRLPGIDRIFSGPGEAGLLELLEDVTGQGESLRFDPEDLDTYPPPAFDLQTKVDYIPILTSRGCPFSCAYCASGLLMPKRMHRSANGVIEEIRYWHHNYHVRDFVLYDDAFLVDSERHAAPILEGIIQTGMKIRFHTPNALHIRGITKETANLLFRAGFKTLRLGLETVAEGERKSLDLKVDYSEFQQAALWLLDVGFTPHQVGAYLLAGLPGQSLAEVTESIRVVKHSGITPIPAYYSPIPHTELWAAAKAASRYDLESDPIYTNNAIFPCQKEPFSWETIHTLKQLVAE
ncbi:Radical SAM domain protein [Olavius algarvensis associated proteobacterium Delta 3]|nr:Radical SAM domain protein [Olavius algarvensis associated proteobacterium Delta 3]CAB5116496.1 Radical SAM domain protein [Olavius algarvensis associated proteobacterium Delta 3]